MQPTKGLKRIGRPLFRRAKRQAGKPFRLGLTGSIGMGKSTVAAMFEGFGIPVFDADAVVRALQGPGGRLVPLIEAEFPGTTHAHGVDRQRLGAHVLADKAAMQRLEALVHPAVAQEQRDFLRRNRHRDLVVLDIPLLFEKGGWRRVDAALLVSAPVWKQRARVLARPGMNAARYRGFVARQMPDHAKRRRADWLVDTGGAKGNTRAAIRRLITCIRQQMA